MNPPRPKDGGFSLMMVALSLMLLLGVAAFAIDLSAMRVDRALDQRVADAAASAGALAAYESGGQTACETALAYVELNLPQIGSLTTANCSTVPTTCNPLTATEVTQIAGRFTVTVVYPVPDADALMSPGALGASSQPVVTADGDPCERFGVRLAATHEASFARVMGFSEGTTTVHAVARAFLPPPSGTPINLLILDRFGCETLKGSGNGGIIIDAIVDPDNGSLLPGEAAADSDGSSGCATDGGVIDIDGSNAILRADGPAGCPNQTGTETVNGQLMGYGCGLIRTLAPGTPGCNWPACTASGGVNPNNPNPLPTAMPARLTRAPVDHRYNCRADYSSPDLAVAWAADPLTVSNEQNIPGCAGGGDHIYDLIKSVGPSGSPGLGWSTWSSSYPCDVPSSHPAISISGNWYINCANFNTRTTITISGGSVVADGNVAITSSTGHLIVDNSASPGYFFLRGGLLSKDGQASLTLDETMVYLSKTSHVQMSGGSLGTLTWIAPDDPSHQFDDLALWSDSTVTTATHFWAGQAALIMEGAFFVPIVTVEYAGQGSQVQTAAQFIADKLHARGQGLLKVSPTADRAVGIRPPPRTDLIR